MIINKEFEKEIVKAIDRIPGDLIFWERRMKNEENDFSKKNVKKLLEYSGLYHFYSGKLVSYMYVAQELNIEVRIKNSSSAYIRKMNIMNDPNNPDDKAIIIIKKNYEKSIL